MGGAYVGRDGLVSREFFVALSPSSIIVEIFDFRI
jgi:hypothetical protein